MQLTLIFIGINIAVFILQQFGLFSGMAFTPSTFVHEPWTVLTSIFMHANLQHLMFNMLGLFMFGSVVEKEFGKIKWAVLYFFAGFSGSLAYMLFGPSIFIPALGASGAIFGLMGGAAVAKPKLVIWTAYGPFPMFIAAIGWGIAEFIGMFGVDTIARSAHFGGLICGVAIALVMLLKVDVKLTSLLVFLPVAALLFFGASLPAGIPAYTNVPAGFGLNSSIHDTGFKQNVYSSEDSVLITITSPSGGDFNLAVYAGYLNSTASYFYPRVFSDSCSEVPDYKVDVYGENAVIEGAICSHKFKAVAAICPKNIDVIIIEFYKNQSLTDNFVSCQGLSS
ncbi:MAG: rhomboid family intramembrane serine protease [Candidatus Nanoarchaeia archaeon]|nr:rhomboid family intramembrane serine protease [Candidatus Nanoarchaeia archaeon]MDD5239438.1 rhomboid family intramembrane serine protease [Candidatus Nanoarchaeia archaeon]